jgi:hypothetical protein
MSPLLCVTTRTGGPRWAGGGGARRSADASAVT